MPCGGFVTKSSSTCGVFGVNRANAGCQAVEPFGAHAVPLDPSSSLLAPERRHYPVFGLRAAARVRRLPHSMYQPLTPRSGQTLDTYVDEADTFFADPATQIRNFHTESFSHIMMFEDLAVRLAAQDVTMSTKHVEVRAIVDVWVYLTGYGSVPASSIATLSTTTARPAMYLSIANPSPFERLSCLILY